MEKLEAQPGITVKLKNEENLILRKWYHYKATSLMSLITKNGSLRHGRHQGLPDVLKRPSILNFFSRLLFYY